MSQTYRFIYKLDWLWLLFEFGQKKNGFNGFMNSYYRVKYYIPDREEQNWLFKKLFKDRKLYLIFCFSFSHLFQTLAQKLHEDSWINHKNFLHLSLFTVAISPNVGKTVAMAPALTEPVSHRQSKISSPAQASSPRPIISDVNEQTQTTTATNPHHRLALQTNGGGVGIGNTFATTKDIVQTITATLEIDNNQFDEQLIQQSPKKSSQFKADHFIEPDFQSAFAQHIQSSNG